MTLVPPFRHGYTIFCDDIRPEVGNKISYMGVYNGLFIPDQALPMALPKLVAAVHFLEPAADAPLDLTVRVFGPGQEDEDDPLFQLLVPNSAPVNKDLVPDLPLEKQVRQLVIPVTFTPFVINSAGRMRAHVQRGDEIYPCGSLLITDVGGLSVASASDGASPSS